uniref:CARD domain-containing protein n=1 Tax=Trichogramma kaykai TaxID=54128 RepID=A0ABD2WAU0_9HYME
MKFNNNFDLTSGDQQKLVELKNLRKLITWEIEKNRHEFLSHVDSYIDGSETNPNLRDIFQDEEVERLLFDSVNCIHNGDDKGARFIEFVYRTGYKDKPKVDENDEPSLHRTTPIHHVVRHKNSNLFNNCSVHDLFKIYDRYDVNYIDELGYTHFYVACKYGLNDVVKKYLEFGQDANCFMTETCDGPLHVAMGVPEGNQNQVVKLLLRNDANPNLANAEGSTPLHILCENPYDQHELAEVFFKITNEKHQIVQVDALDKFGKTPLHYAMANGNKMQIVRVLLRNGAEPNVASNDGSTPLHIFCARGDDDDNLTKIFLGISDELRRPVQLDTQDKEGNTPLHLTLHHNFPRKKVAELLLKRGADLNVINNDGSTPLHIICKRGNDAEFLVKMLFEIKEEKRLQIQVNTEDKQGRTPLHWAVARFLPNVVNILLYNGADLSSFVFPALSHFDEGFKD